MKVRFAAFLLAALLAAAWTSIRAEESVVLVTSRESPIESLDMLEIRKAYLGLNVTVANGTLRAMRPRYDERLNEIFLQTVVSMSERSYERRLLSLTLKYGRPRPTELQTPESVVRQLNQDPMSIAYMWRKDAEKDPSLKIVKVLWQAR